VVSKRKSATKRFPYFDSTESFKLGLALLKEARVPYALIGRLAVWHYVPVEGQQYTKDVDFAVPYGATDVLPALARKRRLKVMALDIGGYGFKGPGVALDVIDRRLDLATLFADAVREAQRAPRARIAGRAVPIVSRNLLIVMKLVVLDARNERDVEELLKVTPPAEYPRLRELARRYLGVAGAYRLDHIARRIGHTGPAQQRYPPQAAPEVRPPSTTRKGNRHG
jgi:hypothetical protein